MAGRDERLPPATRNYVIFGALFVVALGLAARERFGPHKGRGEFDSGLRLLLIGGDPALISALDEVDGFSVTELEPQRVVDAGRELLEQPDAPAYLAALAHADQLGYGFLVLPLEPSAAGPGTDPETAFDWQLDPSDPGIEVLPPEGVPYLVFSVGDLAPEGPRANWAELADIAYEGPVRAADSVRLGLYEHPDLRALWEREGSAHELQARQVLSNRGLLERREGILADQQHWRELDDLWPAEGVIPNSLAQRWEQVRAAPVHGGVLLEVTRAIPSVDAYRHLQLRFATELSLHFVSQAALEGRGEGPPERQACEGLPERFVGEVVIAPDGSALALRDPVQKRVEVYALDPVAGAEGRCRVAASHVLTGYVEPLGRPNSVGRVAWTDDDFLVWHEGPGTTSYSPHVAGLEAYSGPWWVDDRLLAMISEREQGVEYELEAVVTLFDTQRPADARGVPLDSEWVQTSLAFSELLGRPPTPVQTPHANDAHEQLETPEDPQPRVPELLDLRPGGASQLFLLSERCEGADPLDLRPCLHRLRAEPSLLEMARARALAARELDPADEASEPPATDQTPSFALETLGPIGPYFSLAIAAQGERAAWIELVSEGDGPRVGQLYIADLQGPEQLEAVRVDDDLLADELPRISADGRTVLSSVVLTIPELGEVSVARAFVLPPPTQSTPPEPAGADSAAAPEDPAP